MVVPVKYRLCSEVATDQSGSDDGPVGLHIGPDQLGLHRLPSGVGGRRLSFGVPPLQRGELHGHEFIQRLTGGRRLCMEKM